MSNEKLQQLQILEQSLQQLLMQKQSFQAQLMEVESAQEGTKATDEVYKIIGNILIKSKKADVEKELGEKKQMLDIRIKNIEKQEEATRERVKKLRQEVLKTIEKK